MHLRLHVAAHLFTPVLALAIAGEVRAQDAGTAPPVAETAAPQPPRPDGVDLKVEVGDDDGPLTVLNQMPPDMRAKLNAEQIEQIVRRAQTNQNEPPLVAVLAPLGFFLCVFGVVVAVLFARFRRERQLHETLRQMIERGVDIPPALLMPPQVKPNDRRRGVILIALGAGIAVFLLLVDGNDDGAWGLGLVPAFLGAGYLLASYLPKRDDG
ncbi:MAG: hypothetical protein IT383_20040 [Deltaproteobacteria bacterium]|nr:hypothetical protein [Deltaproteobacteria bacterium]